MRKELYYFRDQQGLEVDFLVARPNSNLWLIEAKAGKTVRPSMAAPLLSLRRALLKRSGRSIVVHRRSRSQLRRQPSLAGLKLWMWNDSFKSLVATDSRISTTGRRTERRRPASQAGRSRRLHHGDGFMPMPYLLLRRRWELSCLARTCYCLKSALVV